MSKNKWGFYAMEALAIAGFILSAAFTVIFLEHPDSPITQTQLAVHPVWRNIILGLVLGVYIFAIATAIGKLSGAHANPMLTWAFFASKKSLLQMYAPIWLHNFWLELLRFYYSNLRWGNFLHIR